MGIYSNYITEAYITEGLLSKLFKRNKSQQKSNTIDHLELSKKDINKWVNGYKNKEIRFDATNFCGEAYAYLNLPKNEFESLVKDYEPENDNMFLHEYLEQDNDDHQFDKEIAFLKNNDYFSVGSDGGGDELLYFPKLHVFLQYIHDDPKCQIDLNKKMNYQQVIAMGKEILKNPKYKYIEADKELGYNKL